MEKDISVDEKVVKRLKRWIILKENENLKTRKLNDDKMVSEIKSRIEEEVNATAIH